MSCKAPGRQQRCSGTSTAVSACALQAHHAALLRLEPPGALARQGPSLAQRLGLAPAPPAPLSPAQWLERQQASQRRQDSAGACPICLRAFKAEEQVLLSCSHTFHAACLASFERFSRQTAGAAERSCPLCRCASYEKQRIHDAALLWQHTCATRIQAVWRGVLGRRQARALRRLLPPTHPAVLRRWAAEELGECSKSLVASVDQGAADIEALFAELDATSCACQGVYTALAARCPATGATARLLVSI
ncbi:RING finger 32 [Chlorella sorokiniana]|uniref:RING finger 32 n=1 Tax=Chlorella sorokiniana TaxID=3076 RepID=A0A2P6TIU6_CHLSO|nr:RING finger 32 [Chlorella sorokiniana]|eukprot:PRW39168.1 RING finger 32 [Chlorella sorokiniana]